MLNYRTLCTTAMTVEPSFTSPSYASACLRHCAAQWIQHQHPSKNKLQRQDPSQHPIWEDAGYSTDMSCMGQVQSCTPGPCWQSTCKRRKSTAHPCVALFQGCPEARHNTTNPLSYYELVLLKTGETKQKAAVGLLLRSTWQANSSVVHCAQPKHSPNHNAKCTRHTFT
jgi:proteasome lid subunit RPN8/RPN11